MKGTGEVFLERREVARINKSEEKLYVRSSTETVVKPSARS